MMTKYVNKKKMKRLEMSLDAHVRDIQFGFNKTAAMINATRLKEKLPEILAIKFNGSSYVKRRMKAKFGNSCYLPHQGTQECERRGRQIAKGIIPLDQLGCLVGNKVEPMACQKQP